MPWVLIEQSKRPSNGLKLELGYASATPFLHRRSAGQLRGCGLRKTRLIGSHAPHHHHCRFSLPGRPRVRGPAKARDAPRPRPGPARAVRWRLALERFRSAGRGPPASNSWTLAPSGSRVHGVPPRPRQVELGFFTRSSLRPIGPHGQKPRPLSAARPRHGRSCHRAS